MLHSVQLVIGSDTGSGPLQVKRVPEERTSNGDWHRSELPQPLRDLFARKALAAILLTKSLLYLQPIGGSDTKLQGCVLPKFLFQSSI